MHTGSGAQTTLRELALLFLRLGATAFGGPAAHIAMMQDEVVRRRGWMTDEDFLDLLGATNLIPGPNSTEMAIHIGHRRASGVGIFVAGICFIAPAALITLAFAWAYVRFGTLPLAEGLLHGVKPVIIAVVAQALWSLTRVALKTRALGALALAAAAANVAGLNEVLVLFGAGAAAALIARVPRRSALLVWTGSGASAAHLTGAVTAAATLSTPYSLTALFLFFLKVGAILYGSGYVLLAFLKADLVDQWGWLTNDQLLDAVAIGQVTPGPLFTTATFIGYVLGGLPGAILATAGIFIPAFAFVAVSGPLVPRLRRSPTAGAFLDGVNAGALAVMGIVTFTLARSALVDGASTALALASAVLLIRYRVNSTWLVVGGACAGIGMSFLG